MFLSYLAVPSAYLAVSVSRTVHRNQHWKKQPPELRISATGILFVITTNHTAILTINRAINWYDHFYKYQCYKKKSIMIMTRAFDWTNAPDQINTTSPNTITLFYYYLPCLLLCDGIALLLFWTNAFRLLACFLLFCLALPRLAVFPRSSKNRIRSVTHPLAGTF